jgi:hypothetical protein
MTRTRKVLLGATLVVVALAGTAVVLPPLLWGDHADYSQVVSIKAAPAYQDAALLEKAWALPVARLYRANLEFQSNPSFCGPTSLVNIARSLGQSAAQPTILDGTGIQTHFGMLLGGMTLDEVARVAEQKLHKKVTILRDLDLATFRQLLPRSNDPAVRMSMNFSRGPLFAKGGGHHSPIAGYLADEDLVLVLDVNAKFQPWLVKPERLLEAMHTVDRQTGKSRGLLVIE